MVTIRDVSKLAGVSVATVSRVVNGNKWVAEATRNRVLDAMSELGYQPNSFARSLATNRSDTIGMVVGNLSGPFFGTMMQRAERVIRDAGKHLIVTSGHASLAEERDAVQFLLKRRCDALIVHLDLMPDDELIQLSERAGLPIILVNRRIPALADRCVSMDHEAGGRLATRHLLDQGHRRIAHITGPLFKTDAQARLRGYRQALEEAGIPFDEGLIVESDYLESGGVRALETLQQRQAAFSAIVSGNDLMAIGAINALRQQGVRVPDQCSVVGYDDVVMSAYVVPALSTVRVPVDDFGAEAARLALSLCDGANASPMHFTPELIVRGSTQALDVAVAQT